MILDIRMEHTEGATAAVINTWTSEVIQMLHPGQQLVDLEGVVRPGTEIVIRCRERHCVPWMFGPFRMVPGDRMTIIIPRLREDVLVAETEIHNSRPSEWKPHPLVVLADLIFGDGRLAEEE